MSQWSWPLTLITIRPFNDQQLTQFTWPEKAVNQSSILCVSVRQIFKGCCDWSSSHTLALTHKSRYTVSVVWIRTNTALSHGERDKTVFETMDKTSCLSWCAAAGWGMTVSWQSILSAFTTGSPDLSGYDLSWQLNKHVSHTGILSNFKTLVTHIDLVCFGKFQFTFNFR